MTKWLNPDYAVDTRGWSDFDIIKDQVLNHKTTMMPQVKGLFTLFQPLELLAWHVSRPSCKYSRLIVFSELIPLMSTYILVLVSLHEWDETFHPSNWSGHSMYRSMHCQYPSDNLMTRNLLDIIVMWRRSLQSNIIRLLLPSIHCPWIHYLGHISFIEVVLISIFAIWCIIVINTSIHCPERFHPKIDFQGISPTISHLH